MTPSTRSRLAIAIAAGLTFTACGGADDEAAGTETATTETASTATADSAPPASEPPADTQADTGTASDTAVAPSPDSIDVADEAPAPEPVAVPEALQFSAPLLGGGQIDATTLAGKPTVFWFWAPT